MTRLLFTLVLLLLMIAPVQSAARIVRLAPLPENPPQANEGGLQTWARMHQLGGIDETASRMFIFLPISLEYVRLYADERELAPGQLAELGPWTNAFWIHSNIYGFADGETTDLSSRFTDARVELRWGAPTNGDTAIIPEPRESVMLQPPERLESGLWFRAEFPDVAAAQAFAEAPLRQLRWHTTDTILVFDLDAWLDLELFVPVPLPGTGVIAPLPPADLPTN